MGQGAIRSSWSSRSARLMTMLLLLLVPAMVLAGMSVQAQGAPTQTFTSVASQVSFRYPAGWVAQERFPGWIDIATRPSAIDPAQDVRPGDVWIVLYTAPFTVDMAGYYAATENDPLVALAAYLEALGVETAPESLTIGGVSAAQATFTRPIGAAAALAAPVQASGGPDVFAMLLVQANNPVALQEALPTAYAIAETLVMPGDTLPAGAFPTSVVYAPPTATPFPTLTPVASFTPPLSPTPTATVTPLVSPTPSATPTPYPPAPDALLIDVAGIDLSTIYTAPDGAITLRYPADWVVEERAMGGWQVSGPGVRAALLTGNMLLPELPPGVVLAAPHEALAAYTARSRTATAYGEPVALNAGGRAALRAPASNAQGGLLIYALPGDFIFLFVLEAQAGLPASEAPLLAIASSVIIGP